MATLDSLLSPYPTVPSPTLYDVPLNHNTAWLAWLSQCVMTFQGYPRSTSFEGTYVFGNIGWIATAHVIIQLVKMKCFTPESSVLAHLIDVAILFVCPSVCHTGVDQSKTVQARITKIFTFDCLKDSSFRIRKAFSVNSKGVTQSRGAKWEGGSENWRFSANKSPYLRNGAR